MLITGRGKGKTTSALGQAVRALGHGAKVLIIQFYKNDEAAGDFLALSRLGEVSDSVKFMQYGAKCLHPEKKAALECLTCGACLVNKSLLRKRVLRAIEKISAHKKDYDVIILDEILRAWSFGHISFEEIKELVTKNRKKTWILTGRVPWDGNGEIDKRFYKLCDYYQEIVQHKHPFNRGVKARRGIEW
jgi:cob(I)alamin adenosyltransferase